jgi:hypothetical protein
LASDANVSRDLPPCPTRPDPRRTPFCHRGTQSEDMIDKASSGVSVVEPFVSLQSTVSRATSAATGSYKWLWWVAAAAVALFIFAHPQSPGSSYQSRAPARPVSADHAPDLSAEHHYTPISRPSGPTTKSVVDSGWTKLDDYVPPYQPSTPQSAERSRKRTTATLCASTNATADNCGHIGGTNRGTCRSWAGAGPLRRSVV